MGPKKVIILNLWIRKTGTGDSKEKKIEEPETERVIN